jgi:hypothetical protein
MLVIDFLGGKSYLTMEYYTCLISTTLFLDQDHSVVQNQFVLELRRDHQGFEHINELTPKQQNGNKSERPCGSTACQALSNEIEGEVCSSFQWSHSQFANPPLCFEFVSVFLLFHPLDYLLCYALHRFHHARDQVFFWVWGYGMKMHVLDTMDIIQETQKS